MSVDILNGSPISLPFWNRGSRSSHIGQVFAAGHPFFGRNQIYLHNQIQTGDHARPNEQSKPEDYVSKGVPLFHKLRLHECRKWQLRQLEREQIPSDLVEDAEHENLMHDGAEQECKERSLHLR